MGFVTLRRAGEQWATVVGWAGGLGLLASVGCAGPREAAGRGQSCYRTADCREGLLCIDSYCSADLASQVPTDEVGPPAPMAPSDAGGDGAVEAGSPAVGGQGGAGGAGTGATAGAGGAGAGAGGTQTETDGGGAAEPPDGG